VQQQELAHDGRRYVFGVVSDIHFGNSRCRVDFLQDFIRHAYSRGARTIFHCGDLLDGDYSHGRYELAQNGLDAQCYAAWHGLPQLEGLQYVGISGNHEATLGDRIGIDAGQYCADYFRRYGRSDLRHIGRRAGWYRLQVPGGASVLVFLWHPKGRGGQNFEPMLKRRIAQFPRGGEPDFMFAGHLHGFAQCVHRDVRAFMAGTFHGHGSDFSNSLGTEQSLSGIVMSFELTSTGHIGRYSAEHCQYRESYPEHHGLVQPAQGQVMEQIWTP